MSRATIVTGMGFGDEGKGTVVDALCREAAEAPLVVRHNGGCQAAHNVITPDGRHHTFAQFGAGSLAPGVATLLSRFALIEPFALAREAAHLKALGLRAPLARLFIDARALLITPFHQAANRIRESLRTRRHGSCGLGIGEVMADSIAAPELDLVAADLRRPSRLLARLRAVQERKRAELREGIAAQPEHVAERDRALLEDPEAPALFAEALAEIGRELALVDEAGARRLVSSRPLIFEGAQGVLLDEWYGFHPFTTWSTTTTANALRLLDEWQIGEAPQRLGVLRAYATRHGAGPFPTEDPSLAPAVPELHNGQGPWQGAFRVGPFDAVLARYAREVCEVDAVALTHLDRAEALAEAGALRFASAYEESRRVVERLPVKEALEDLDAQALLAERLAACAPRLEALSGVDALIEVVEGCLRAPVALGSWGPRAQDKRRLARASG